MSETTPEAVLPRLCWPLDFRMCEEEPVAEWTARPEHVRQRSEVLAVTTLRALTAYRVGGCPVTVRPCLPTEGPRTYRTYGVAGGRGSSRGAPWAPYLVGGAFINCGCGGRSCGCDGASTVRLEGGSRVDAVRIEGATLDPAAYRLDPGGLLVRIDGQAWPRVQHMDRPAGAPGTWEVDYLPGAQVDLVGAHAAAVLALEYAKACAGDTCGLPTTVTQVVRQGVTITIEPGAFPGGLTGLKDVDAYITRWNPEGRVGAAPRSRVTNPDRPRPRRVGSPGGTTPPVVFTAVDGGTPPLVGTDVVDGGSAPVVGADVVDGGGA